MDNATAEYAQAGEDTEEVHQQIVAGVAHFGAEAVIKALSDACYIAAAVHEELEDRPRMRKLLEYAHQLDDLAAKRAR